MSGIEGHLCECGEWHEPAKDARLAAFAEGVAASKNDTAGTRAAARYALTGSLESAVDEMRRAAAPAEAREEGPDATGRIHFDDDGCYNGGSVKQHRIHHDAMYAIHQQDTDRAAR